MLADQIGGTVEVTLFRPPPLDKPLALSGQKGQSAFLHDGDVLIAEAREAGLDLAPPEFPDWDGAAEAQKSYAGFRDHPFATCFVCGPDRGEDDGLRIFPGRVAGGELVAAPWTPTKSLGHADGRVEVPYVAAALDCPGYFARLQDSRRALLGRLTLRIDAVPEIGERCVVIGWPMGADGRKHFSGTALADSAGRTLAVAKAVWIEIHAPGP